MKTITATISQHQWVEPATLVTVTLLCTLLGFYAQQFAQKIQASPFIFSDWGSF